MKNIIKVFFASLVILMAGCTEKGPVDNGNDKINENIEIIVKALKVEGTTATIKVEHDGTTANPWYGFLTTETDAMKAYQNKVKELTANGKIEDLNYKTSLTKTFKDLEPNTNYLYVAFGITEEGEIYGIPASDKFTTGRNKVQMTVNPAWKIEYAGPNKIGDVDYKYTAKITSTDKNKYIVTAYSKEMFELNDIFDIADYELSYLKAYIEAVKEEQPNITISDALITGSYTEGLNIIPGDWYAIAIGVTDKGELSGLYAVSDLISIPRETPTPEYSSWVGNWTWTGSNGISATVKIAEDNPNYTYYLYGWDGYSEDSGLAIMMEWNTNNDGWVIYPSYLGDAEFSTSSGNVMGSLYVAGTYETTDGGKNYYDLNYPICGGVWDDNGNMFVIGYEDTAADIQITMMELIAFIQTSNGVSASLATMTDLPTFPAIVTKAEGAAANNIIPNSLKKAQRRTPVQSRLPKDGNRQNMNLNSKVTIR